MTTMQIKAEDIFKLYDILKAAKVSGTAHIDVEVSGGEYLPAPIGEDEVYDQGSIKFDVASVVFTIQEIEP